MYDMKTREEIVKILQGKILWVSYGGGTNSTAKILKLIELNIIPDLITFADTGGEHPHTYEYVDMFDKYIQEKGFPKITRCEYTTKDGERLTLEEECLRNKQLPSLAYGFKTCSLKHKLGAQEQYVKKHEVFGNYVSEARKGNCDRIVRTIGYDAGEPQRMYNAMTHDRTNKEFENVYPLIDWFDMDRQECIEVIESSGLPLPGKSSCFFCPAMKRWEIRQLRNKYPELYERAIAMERNAFENFITVKGLGRGVNWEQYMKDFDSQMNMCNYVDEDDDENMIACGCYDG